MKVLRVKNKRIKIWYEVDKLTQVGYFRKSKVTHYIVDLTEEEFKRLFDCLMESRKTKNTEVDQNEG